MNVYQDNRMCGNYTNGSDDRYEQCCNILDAACHERLRLWHCGCVVHLAVTNQSFS